MTFGGKKATLLLFLGDVAIFLFSLWLTLLVRYQAVPGREVLAAHVPSFSFLFLLWLLVFYMAGLYGKRVVLFKSHLWGAILQVQVVNIILGALFFFFVPGIGIAPKTNLVLYLFISLALIFIWRLWLFPRLTRPSYRERAAIIGAGPEVQELVAEVNGNPRYHLKFSVIAAPEELVSDFEAFETRLAEGKVTLLVVDTEHDSLRPLLGRIYELAFVTRDYQFTDLYTVYEEVFDRVPLSLLQYEWFLKNVTGTAASNFYAFAKRIIDLIGGLAMGVVTVLLVPVLWVLMRFEGPGPLFIGQDRLGKLGVRVRCYKFRTMRQNEQGKWMSESANRVTKLGALLRRTSLDEFPQFVNVLKGEISLIGPRNDMEELARRLAESIPYYNVRYIVQPGITGWAQINQQYEPGNISPQSIEETKTRLAYDFYYIKNRSLALDLVIALKTVKRMLFRVSSW